MASKRRPAKPSKRGAQPRARMGRPPGKSSEQTRAEILTAAREQFMREGFEGATNRAIAEGAGVTAGAIYGYFDSKAALYMAVVDDTLAETMPRVRAVVDAAPSAREALSAIVREQLAAERDRSMMRFLVAVPAELQRHPELAEAMVAQPGSFFDLVLEVVQRGTRSGEIERERAEQVVGVFVAGLIGLAIHGGTVPREHSDAAVAGFIALLEGSLFR